MNSSDPELTRRQLLVSGAVAAGYALAVQPVSAQTITTPADGLVAGMVEIPVDGGKLPAYRASPDRVGSFPVVLVVHEIFGVHEYIRDVCRRLARKGFFAVAPDLYQRQGDVGKLADVSKIIDEVVKKVPDAQVMSDLDATLAWAKRQQGADAGRAVITGFCWGGRIVWLYSAHNPKLRAGAAWYGRLVGDPRGETPRHPVDIAGEPHAPVLGLYGSEDRGIPLSTVDSMRRKLAERESADEIVVFPASPHGFHADYRESYRPMAATEAWRQMLDWFRKHGAT